MRLASETPPSWEAILGAFIAGGTVQGKQTLVKVLALLQLEGFPVEIRFQEFARGPHSFVVHGGALHAAASGYLEVETKELGQNYQPRCDYRLTAKGRALVEAWFERAKVEDDGEILVDIVRGFSSTHSIHRPGSVLGRYLHDILAWDDEEAFEEEFAAIHEWFEAQWRDLEGQRPESEYELLLHACVETVVVALRGIEPKLGGPVTREEFVGIRFLRYNAAKLREDLIAREQGLDEHAVANRIRRNLFAFEANAVRYGFLEELDDEELDGLLREAGRFHSGLET